MPQAPADPQPDRGPAPPTHGPRDLAAIREEYSMGGLDAADLTPEPLALFGRWLEEALAAGVHEPTAMSVSTVSADGQPSSRAVLLKGVDERGFVFFTNTASRKGRDLAANPRCALLFGWHQLQRQVRVEGTALRLGADEVKAYFDSRPRGSRLGAWASPQSLAVADRAELAEAFAAAERRFAGAEVPVPEHWGGYRVVPSAVEFWQGRPNRLHDRLRYRRESAAADWGTERLAP